MSKLTFWCDEETGESSPSDSPYFLVYVGDGQKLKSVVKRVRKESWDDNVDAGEPARSATVSFPEVSKFDLVMVALLEEDWDPDAGLAGKVHNWMDNLDGLLQVFRTSTGGSVVNIFREEFKKAIENLADNDDLIDVRRFASSGATRSFFTGGGHYRVKFEF